MGLIDRLRRITMGRIEAFLDRVERPEDVLPDIVRQLQAKVKQVADAEVKALTALKGACRRLDEASGKMARMESGAAAAVQAGEDALARQALAAQIDAEKRVAAAEAEVARAQGAYDAAKTLRLQFQRDVATLKQRSGEIIARARAARARQAVSECFAVGGSEDLLETIARMEEKVAQREDTIEAAADVAADLRIALADVSDETARSEEVQQRLDALKRSSNL